MDFELFQQVQLVTWKDAKSHKLSIFSTPSSRSHAYTVEKQNTNDYNTTVTSPRALRKLGGAINTIREPPTTPDMAG